MTSAAQLAPNVKQYTYNLVATQWQAEMRKQFDAWIGPGSFVNNVGDAIDKAADNQATVLKKSAEKQREAYERAMFIFSLVAPLALSWFAGSLQYIVGPKLFTKVGGDKWNVINGIRIYEVVMIENKVYSKMLGDMGKDLVSRGLPLVLSAVAKPAPLQTNGPAASHNGLTLKSNIEMDIKAQKDGIIGELMAIAQNINNSSNFGDLIVAKYKKENPAAKDATPEALERGCKEMVNKIVNNTREDWATKYPIYGMSPPTTALDRIVKLFESNMWALWLNQNNYRAWARYTNDYRPSIGPGATGEYLPADIAIHILDNFTGLHALQLEYMNEDRFTLDAINSLKIWATKKLQNSPLSQLKGDKRTLNPIENYF